MLCVFLYTFKGGDIMGLLKNQTVDMVWRGNNKDYYESKGYMFTKYGDKFLVKAEDLSRCNSKKILVQCDMCEKINEISFAHYNNNITHNDGKYICQKCSIQVRHNKDIPKRRNKYITKINEICDNCGYEFLSSELDIKKNTDIITYRCPKHGIHKMRVANFINGKRCPDCAKEYTQMLFALPNDEVIKRVTDCGGEIINPEEYINNNTYNLIFKCRECGNLFNSSLERFTQHGGQVCKSCSNYESYGEKRIRYYLENHNLEFEQQKWFADCKDKKPLPFDFYLLLYNTIIEFDGRQHFMNVDSFKHGVKYVALHDEIKNKYCHTHNIKLIRIPYTEITKIDSILNNELFT